MRIFNRIRRKLLVELKIHNYLLYAIGEILLITVGVMIGLYLNNWNKELSTRNEEEKTLLSLQESFRANQREIIGSLREYDDALRTTNLRIDLTGPIAKVPVQVVLDSIIIIDYVQLSYLYGSSAPAVSQDELMILTSRKLTIELNRYPIQYNRYRAAETNFNALVDQLREIHQRHVSLLTEENHLHAPSTGHDNAHPADYQAWLRDRMNQNKSVECKWKIQQAGAELERLKAANSRILKLIETELWRLKRARV